MVERLGARFCGSWDPCGRPLRRSNLLRSRWEYSYLAVFLRIFPESRPYLKTVSTYKQRLMEKLNVDHVISLAHLMAVHGLIDTQAQHANA